MMKVLAIQLFAFGQGLACGGKLIVAKARESDPPFALLLLW
jgi:hypothetical protein